MNKREKSESEVVLIHTRLKGGKQARESRTRLLRELPPPARHNNTPNYTLFPTDFNRMHKAVNDYEWCILCTTIQRFSYPRRQALFLTESFLYKAKLWFKPKWFELIKKYNKINVEDWITFVVPSVSEIDNEKPFLFEYPLYTTILTLTVVKLFVLLMLQICHSQSADK